MDCYFPVPHRPLADPLYGIAVALRPLCDGGAVAVRLSVAAGCRGESGKRGQMADCLAHV
jgi:hypothetical protein